MRKIKSKKGVGHHLVKGLIDLDDVPGKPRMMTFLPLTYSATLIFSGGNPKSNSILGILSPALIGAICSFFLSWIRVENYEKGIEEVVAAPRLHGAFVSVQLSILVCEFTASFGFI